MYLKTVTELSGLVVYHLFFLNILSRWLFFLWPLLSLLFQVSDSGMPCLSSSTLLTVRVIEESLHRPLALPLEIHVVTMEDEFPGGVIGQLHATDADPYDALTFGHALPAQRSLFKISPHDGKIIALGGLDAGSYFLNASVSDGRFVVTVPVSIHVEQATFEMLRDAVTVRFESVAPADFVSFYLKSVLKVMQQVAQSQQQDELHLLSLQSVGGTQQLDMLVTVGTAARGYYKAAYVTQKLSTSRRKLEEVLRVSAILDKNCSGLECRGAQCEQNIIMDSHNLVTYSTQRFSFVSPRFYRTSHCTCNGKLQEFCKFSKAFFVNCRLKRKDNRLFINMNLANTYIVLH